MSNLDTSKLSIRAKNALSLANIKTLEELIEANNKGIFGRHPSNSGRIRSCGIKTVKEIRKAFNLPIPTPAKTRCPHCGQTIKTK